MYTKSSYHLSETMFTTFHIYIHTYICQKPIMQYISHADGMEIEKKSETECPSSVRGIDIVNFFLD